MFIKSWAYMCRLIGEQIADHDSLSLPPELKPFYDRTVIKNPANLNQETVDLDRSLMFYGGGKEVLANSTRRTFQLTRENIEKLRQIVNKQHAYHHQVLRTSTFSLTYAYILCCLVKAEGINEHDKVVAIFAIDCRSHLEPPLPPTYFGNCIVAGIIETKGLLGREGGLSMAVKEIVEAIKSLEMNEVMNEAEKRGSQIMSSIRSASRLGLKFTALILGGEGRKRGT
ncbi:Anthocyanin 5-aromatic acyltransferase [Morus notabilis]|uniref:Anthocyanin 5-aromatic acyltransferase n=1 Tax=Morus notabilis TaxID=981085 RepID=W9QIR7_9ROSA|nr:Anthocyanin 5-aromatic acyltransferase [Morus notabilis]